MAVWSSLALAQREYRQTFSPTASLDDVRRLSSRVDKVVADLRAEQTKLSAELQQLSAAVGSDPASTPDPEHLARLEMLGGQLRELEAQSVSLNKAIESGLDRAVVADSVSKLDAQTASVRAELEKEAAVKAPAPVDLRDELAQLKARIAELEARPVTPPPVAVAPAPPPVEAPAAAPAWYQRLKLEGLAEGYYSYRFQGSPADKTNELRAFDTYNNTFTPSFGKLALSLGPQPAGFRLDLAFGPVADLGSPDIGSPGAEIFKHLLQAYATVKLFDRLTVDFGKFVTSAGAEVFENNNNWLSSRSMIFTYGPYTHSGLRAQYAINDVFTVQGSVVNGWDTILTANSWKTFNVSAFMTLPTTSLAFSFYGGPQSSPALRLLFDVVANQKLGDRFSMNLNAIYGSEGSAKWYAGALMGRVELTDSVFLAARVEYFGDPDGHRTGLRDAHYVNSSVGAGWRLINADGFGAVELRPEVRHDQMLPRGMFGAGGGGTIDGAVLPSASALPFVNGTSASQTTVCLTMVAWF